jgi:asparagine synthase (glutamine-hydrolysing)
LLPNYHLAIAEAVRKHGSRTLLTGHDGDSVVGYGRAYPLQLLREHDWEGFREVMENYAAVADFSHEWPEWARWNHRQRYRYLLQFYVKPEVKKAAKNRQFGNVASLAWQGVRRLDYPLHYWAEDAVGFLKNKMKRQTMHSRVFANDTDFGFGAAIDPLISDMVHGGMVEGTEQFAHVAAHYGHEAAHPFYDKRLLELCLAIPERLKFDNGYRRGPLRRALVGVLPEAVRLRTSKVQFDDVIMSQIRANAPAWRDLLGGFNQLIVSDKLAYSAEQKTYLIEKIEAGFQQLTHPNTKPTQLIRLLHLASWMQSTT